MGASKYEGANVVASLDSTGHVKDTYLYDGVDSPLRLKRAGSYYFYELDLAGNVRRIRGLNGPDLGGYRYTAFGQAIAGQAPAVDQPLRWKGRWYLDVAGGVYDVRARWWSPMLGSFLSVDEFEFHDEESTLWGWPGQNALTWSDPTGHRRSADENNAVFNAAERGELGDWAQTYAAAFRGRAEGMSMLSNDASVNAGLAKIRQAGCLFVLGGAQAIASAVLDIGLANAGVGIEKLGLLGGSHRMVRAANAGGEVHHMPAWSVLAKWKGNPFSYGRAPGIWMEKADHALTASHGSQGLAGQLYREAQLAALQEGRILDAIAMDVADIRSTFGTKYDAAIQQYGETMWGLLSK